jgi:hypothetical protein
MLLQSLRAPYLAPGGPGSIWNYLGAPVRSTGVSGRFACGFRTDLHFADVPLSAFGIILESTPACVLENVLEGVIGRVHTVYFGAV